MNWQFTSKIEYQLFLLRQYKRATNKQCVHLHRLYNLHACTKYNIRVRQRLEDYMKRINSVLWLLYNNIPFTLLYFTQHEVERFQCCRCNHSHSYDNTHQMIRLTYSCVTSRYTVVCHGVLLHNSCV